MSIMKMYVEEYLAAEQVAENRYIIHLSNGKETKLMESRIKIKATVPEMREFFEKDSGVRYRVEEIERKRREAFE